MMVVHYGKSALPSERYVQNYYFRYENGPYIEDREEMADTLGQRMRNFYTQAHAPGTTPISKFMGAGRLEVADALCYDLGQSVPRQRFQRACIENTDYINSSVLPSEVAVAMSFRSSNRTPRGRGRVFHGPFITGASAGSSANEARPHTNLINALVGAGGWLIDQNDHWAWCVFSPSDNVARPVVGGWVDNAFDTQRSRGYRPTDQVSYGDVEWQPASGWLPRT